MDHKGTKSVVHRMAEAGRDGFDARAMSPSKALRLSLAKAADTLFGLALKVTTVEQRRVSAAELEGAVGGDGLISLLDGRAGACGAIVLDLAFLSAIIEMQTMGRVRPAVPEPRPLTRTDAAIAAPLIDALLEGYDVQMLGVDPDHRALDLRFGDKMENARGLALTLEGAGHDMFRISADIDNGAKSGCVTVLLPMTASPGPRAAAGAPPGKAAGRIRDAAMTAPVALDAVVARIRLPLRELCALEVGACLPVDRDMLEKTQLLATRGHWVADVKLGQMNGWRAVRLTSGPARPAQAAPPDAPGRPADSAGTQAAGTGRAEGDGPTAAATPNLPQTVSS